MKILIIGADGQLGTDLCRVIPENERIPLTIKDIDITDREQTFKALNNYHPDLVINTAAYNRVDAAEENNREALLVNRDGVRNLAEACGEINAVLVHISTDYVFNGEKKTPYTESDRPDPISEYGKSKFLGEEVLRNMLESHFIIRSTGLYGAVGCMGKGGSNFVEEMIKQSALRKELKVVADEFLSPTYTLDLAEKMNELIRTKRFGTYHIVNQGSCSWHGFASRIFELLGKDIVVLKAAPGEFKRAARRPKYSVLANAKLKELGMDDMRPWEEALKAYLIEKGHLNKR